MFFRILLCTGALLASISPSWGQSGAEDAFSLARNLYRDARDYATAADLFADFLRNYPDDQQASQARLLLARSHKNNQRCDLAIPAYEDFFRRHPEHLSAREARQERAACLSEEGRHLEAARAYEEVQRRFRASDFAPQALLEAAVNYTLSENVGQAIHLYQRLIEEYNAQPQAHQGRYQLALLLFTRGHSDRAQRLLAQVAGAEPAPAQAPRALLLDGRIDLFLGREKGARATFGQLHKRFPAAAASDSAYIELAAFLLQRNQFKEAGSAYDQAYKHIRNKPLKHQALLGLADAQRQNGQYQVAVGHYKNLLKVLKPDQPYYNPTRLGLAIAHGMAEEYSMAIGLFQALIQEGPNTAEALVAARELGALYRRRGNYNQAITWYRRYLGRAPEGHQRDQAQYALAQIYSAVGYYDESIQVYRTLVETSPTLAADAQYGLANAFEQNGLLQLALRDYVHFLERFPGHRLAPTVRQRIEYLRQFTVMDPAGLNRALQQALISELSGQPRQRTLLELARALYTYRDLPNAVSTFETYAAAYAGDPSAPEAQFYLAESLYKLSQQRQVENQQSAVDSLRQIALQEYRILANSSAGDWAQQAQIRLIETEAEAAPLEQRPAVLEQGFAAFLEKHNAADNPHRALALLRLADARRQLGAADGDKMQSAGQTYNLLLEQFPDSPLVGQARFGLGLCMASREEYEAAADMLSRCLEDNPDLDLGPRVLFELGNLHLQQGQLTQAIARFQELLLAYPAFEKRRDAQWKVGEVLFGLEEYREAAAAFAQLAESEPADRTNARSHRRLAESYHRSGQVREALELYQRIGRDMPYAAARDSVYYGWALVLAQLGRGQEATAQFVEVSDEFPNSPLAPLAAQQAGHLLFEQGDNKEAYATYKPLLVTSVDPKVHAQTAMALYRLKRREEARKVADKFKKQFGDDPYWSHRILIEEGSYYLGQGNVDRALKIFAKVKKSDSTAGEYFVAQALWEKNRRDPSQEATAKALEALIQFVKKHPQSTYAAHAHLQLGKYYFGLSQYLPAAGAFRHIVEGEDDPQLRQEAIWMLLNSYFKANEYDAAHRTANQLLREFPNHAQIRQVQLQVGIILNEKGQYAQSISHFEKVLEWAVANDAAEATYYIGSAQQNMGDYREAIGTYYKVSYFGAEASSMWITNADYQRAQCHEALSEYKTAITIYQRIIQREGRNSAFGEEAQGRIDSLRARIELNK